MWNDRAMPRSVLTTTPWRRAWVALWRRPSLLVAALLVGGVVGLVAAAPVLFVSSVGAGAVQVQWSKSCPASVAPTMDPGPPDFAGTPPDEFLDPLDRLTTAVGDDHTFATPEHIQANYSATPVTFGDKKSKIGFINRPGALDHVDRIGTSVDGEIWIPDTLANDLGAGPGDSILIGGGTGIPVVVAGVFRDLAARPLDQYWCAANKAIVPQNLFGEIFPPPMAILTDHVNPDLRVAGSLIFSRYVAPFAVPPRTVADARQRLHATEGLRDRVEAANPGDSIVAGIDRLADRAQLVRDAVRDTTLPVALLAIGCALALAAVLGTLWMRVRRNSGIALTTIGVSPSAIGAKAAAETALPLLVGGALGTLVARWSMGAWAPSTTLEPGTVGRSFAVAGIAVAVGLVLVGVTAGWTSRSLLRVAAPPRRSVLRYIPFELVFVAVAWWAARDLQPEALVAIEGKHVVDTGSSVLLLPLAVLALAASLTARLWFWVTARRRSATLPSRLAPRLAVRRLQFGARTGSALLGAGTLALGVSVFGLAMNASLARTGDAKAAVFVGGRSSLLIAAHLPAGVKDASEVWVRKEVEYAGLPVDVVAIDPASFADVAFWDDAFADQSLAELIDSIDRPADDGTVPALLVGEAPPYGELTNPKRPGDPIPVQVVHTVRAFPGAGRDRPTLVTTVAAVDGGPIGFRHYVWANGSYEAWRPKLQDLGAQPLLGLNRQQAIDGSVLQFATWSFDFVRALGVFVGLLVVAALVLHLSARQRQHALEFAFLRRMGFSARRHWGALVLETAGLASVMVVLGVSSALFSARIISPYVDPLPSLLPDPLSVVPWQSVVGVFAIALPVVLGGTAAAQAAGSRVDVSEVLRDGT